jgi:mannosyl-3-phosphoglycerate phosphatase
MNYIVFSDLDGTLLNHDDYSFKEALPLIEYLNKNFVPLIFNTSKTKNECLRLQKEMGIKAPFIVENGAAIFGLEDEVIEIGMRFEEILEFIKEVESEFGLMPFSSMRVEEVMEWTGFSYESAKMAKERDFSEPFLIRDERDLTQLEKIAEDRGLKILKGGRFYHMVSIDQDKGVAVSEVLKRVNSDVTSIALGDNYNDVDMLKEVDIPILIPHHKNSFIDVEIEGLIKAKYMGSKGWSEALKEIFDVSKR